MNRARWERVEMMFQAALDRHGDDRTAYLDEACAGDPALREEVMQLLAQHDTESDFLEQPLVDLARAGGASDDVSVPVMVGAYRIVREIGAGGMGVVFLAVQEGPGFERPVAVKVIRRGMDTDDILRRFTLERRILAALNHPNIAHFLDAGATDDGRPFVVMDFVEGAPIDQYCTINHLPLRERLRLFQTVCAAVQHAHNNLIVHRDIKPGNILVTMDGTPVLLDFGIGKLLDSAEPSTDSHTRTGAHAFTPEYAAPEQLLGRPVTTSTDVYGLGLLLYRMLTGERPFSSAGTAADHERVVLETEPPRPSAVGGRELAGDIDTIVLKTLRKEPERRYLSVAALSDDIQRHLDGLPVRARADTFAYRSGKFVRRHRLALAATAIVFLSLIAATAYSARQTLAVTRERDKALEVRTFLMEMFGASGRDHADTVSVRQLLDGQAKIVPIAYVNRPEMRAQMQAVIAEGYDRLGLFAEAEPLARDALAIRRATLSASHPYVAASVSLLGWILHERGRSAEGEAMLRVAVALWPNARPPNPGEYARTLNDLGVNREAAGKYDEAGDLYRQSLAMRKRQDGDTDRGVATTSSNLSVILYRKGDLKGAIAVAEDAQAAMRRAAGPDHQRSMLIQGNIAAMRAASSDLAGAETDYRDLLTRQSRVLGRDHPQTGGIINSLGSTLRSQKKYAAADSFLTEALAIFEKAYGPKHARVGNTLVLLAGLQSSTGRLEEAHATVGRALAIHRALHAEPHRDVAQALSALGMVNAEAGNWAAAERAHRLALDTWTRAPGAQKKDLAAARARLALALIALRRPTGADSVLGPGAGMVADSLRKVLALGTRR